MSDETKKAIQECRYLALTVVKGGISRLDADEIIRLIAEAIEKAYPEAFEEL